MLGHVKVLAHEAHDWITDHAKSGAVGIDLRQLLINAFVFQSFSYANSYPGLGPIEFCRIGQNWLELFNMSRAESTVDLEYIYIYVLYIYHYQLSVDDD